MSKHGRIGMRLNPLLGVCTLQALAPPMATACSACATTANWAMGPLLMALGLLGYGWLIASVIHRRRKLPHFKWWGLFLYIVAAWMAVSALALGGLMFLIAGPFYLLTMLTPNPRLDSVRAGELKIAKIVGMIALPLLVLQLVWPQHQTQRNLIMHNPDTVPGRTALRNLAGKEPVDLSELRGIIHVSNHPEVWRILGETVIESGNGREDALFVVDRFLNQDSEAPDGRDWRFTSVASRLADIYPVPDGSTWSPRQWHDWLTSDTMHTTGTLTVGAQAQ